MLYNICNDNMCVSVKHKVSEGNQMKSNDIIHLGK